MKWLKRSSALVLAIGLALPCAFASRLHAQAAKLTPAPEGSFTLCVIPDTQGYRGRATKSQPKSTDPLTNTVFDRHTRWIVANLESQRIVFVSHVGDIVDRNVPEQWALARTFMDRIHGRVPYGICVGNHDMRGGGDSSLFQQQFPASRFKDFPWYGGCFPGNPDKPKVSCNNANSFQLFSAEGMDFVFLHIECCAPDNVLKWADGVMDKHADRWAIITSHMDLGPLHRPRKKEDFITAPKGRMTWTKVYGSKGNTPQQMWDECYRKHANLLMICSGDQSRTTACYLPKAGDHGNMVHAMTSDYTSSGPLRLYRFKPKANEIQVITYNTRKSRLVDETHYVPGRENHQFTIKHKLSPKPAQAAAAGQ